MTFRGEARLWVAQRASAAILALCVAVHLVTIIYAVRHGLTAGEILERTRGAFIIRQPQVLEGRINEAMRDDR